MPVTKDEIDRVRAELLSKHRYETLAIASMMNAFAEGMARAPENLMRMSFSTLFTLIDPELKRRGVTIKQIEAASNDLLQANITLRTIESLFPDA